MNVPQELIHLSQTLRSIPTIKQSRVSGRSLYKARADGHTFELMECVGNARTIHAFGALWPTKHPDWLEIGTLYVSDKYGGRGISNTMVFELLKLAKSLKKSVFLVTTNPKIQSIATGMDFVCADRPFHSPCAEALGKKRDLREQRKVFYFNHSS